MELVDGASSLKIRALFTRYIYLIYLRCQSSRGRKIYSFKSSSTKSSLVLRVKRTPIVLVGLIISPFLFAQAEALLKASCIGANIRVCQRDIPENPPTQKTQGWWDRILKAHFLAFRVFRVFDQKV